MFIPNPEVFYTFTIKFYPKNIPNFKIFDNKVKYTSSKILNLIIIPS